jgi:hypothetical protein
MNNVFRSLKLYASFIKTYITANAAIDLAGCEYLRTFGLALQLTEYRLCDWHIDCIFR